MTRIVPLTGTEEERQLVTGNILPNELHTTSDHKRTFLQNIPVAPVYHGAVANEAAMLALRYTSPRGCFAGDMCKRTDVPTATFYLCVSRDGREAVDWVQITRTVSFLNLTDAPSAYTGHGGKLVRVNDAADGLAFQTYYPVPAGGTIDQVLTKLGPEDGNFDWRAATGGAGGGGLYEEVTIPELEIDFTVGTEFSRTGWVYGPGHVNANSIASTLDNNSGTVWQSETAKVVGMRFSVDMLTDKLCASFRINHNGVSSGDRATLVTVETSLDGSSWTSHGDYAVSTSVDDSDFLLAAPTLCRYFRLVVVTPNGTGWWTINEIRAYEADISLTEDAGGLLELDEDQNAMRVLATLTASTDGAALAVKLEDPAEPGEFFVYSATWQSGFLRITKFRTFDDSYSTEANVACAHFTGLADFRVILFASASKQYFAAEIKGRAVALVETTAALVPAFVGGALLTGGASWEFTRVGTDSL